MDTFSVCVTIVSALLSIAYPIIIQITSNDKYSSEVLLNLFDNKTERKVFLPNLILVLIFIGIYLLNLSSLFQFKTNWVNFIFENSALIIISILTILLIINFIRLVKIVQTFYRTSALIEYLSKYKNEVIENNNFETFDCLADLLYWSIQNQDTNASKQLSNYFYDIFQDYREKHDGKQALIFPDKFYLMIYRTIEKIVNTDKNVLHVIEHRAVSGIWILGEYSNTAMISEESYRWLWKNLVLMVNKDKDDLIFNFWENSHQFFKYNFEYISPEYQFEDGEYFILNQKEIDLSNILRDNFFEFHIALGGLLLFKQKFDLIKKIFNYTTSIPADYVLLPKHMFEIYQLFLNFFDPYDRKYPWITHKYYFPGLNGLNADREIKDWICKYLSLLFIRQLNITSHYSGYDPTELHNLPNELAEKRFWAENIKYFNNYIDDILKAEDGILKIFGFNEDKNIYLTKAKQLEEKVIQDYSIQEQTNEPTKEKVQLFYESSNDILKSVFSKYKEIGNEGILPPGEEILEFNIQGLSNITDKSTFLDNGIEHMNFHTFLAESVSKRISEGYFQIFNSKTTTKFVFEQENVFTAISKMKLNPDLHLIIVFGFINIEYYIENLKTENLLKDKYNGISIRYYSGTAYGLSNSIFILNKEDLPFVEYIELNNEIEDLYELERINTDFNIYATVSDLNKNTKLRTELEKDKNSNNENLTKSVLQAIMFKILIKWKKEIKMYQIYVKNSYDEKRKESNIDEVKAF